MTDKRKSGQAYAGRGTAPVKGWRERFLDICEHLLVLAAFLIFLSFVQSVTATQQELDSNYRAHRASSAIGHIQLGSTAGAEHAHA